MLGAARGVPPLSSALRGWLQSVAVTHHSSAASFVPGDWSDVTADWMTGALRRDFPDAEVGSVEVLSTDDGTNRRARLGISYTKGGGPEVVFAKAEGPWRESHAKNGNLFNEPELFASRAPLPVDHPYAYHVVIDYDGLDYVIVMEDVRRRGADARDATRPMTISQVENGVRQLAALHSSYWNLPARPSNLQWLQTWEATDGWRESLGRGLPIGRGRVAELLPGPVADCPDDALLNLCMQSISTFASGSMTLLHADPHIGNTYVLPGDQVGFLDWQVCRRGSWSMDLSYYMVSALTVNERREAEDQLLDTYVQALTVPDSDRPDREEVQLRYAAAHPYGLVVWLVTHQSDRAQSPEVCRALIERFAAAFVDHASAAAVDRLR